MSKRTRMLTIFFVLISSVHVLAILVGNSLWQMLTKPMIVPVIAVIYLIDSSQKNKWYLLALFFSLSGDLLLMDRENLFLFGVGAFLITQILYIFLFSKGIQGTGLKLILKAIFPFFLYYVLLIQVLKPGLGNYFVPILIYGFVISLFGSVSLWQYLRQRDRRNLTLLIGAVLFIASDSMIALNMFHETRALYPILIMITYVLSQYLIMRFVLRSEVKIPLGNH